MGRWVRGSWSWGVSGVGWSVKEEIERVGVLEF